MVCSRAVQYLGFEYSDPYSEEKKIIFLRPTVFIENWFLVLIFQNPTLVKSKKENRQNLMCDTSKEPHWLSDH